MASIPSGLSEWLQVLLLLVLASIPGIWALFSQRSKQRSEKAKTDSESEKLNADALHGYTNVTALLQEVYQDMLNDIKKQSQDCRDNIVKLNKEMKLLQDKNEILEKELNETRQVLYIVVDGIKILTNQLRVHEIEPEFDIEKETLDAIWRR